MKNSKSLKSQFEQLAGASVGPNLNLVAETIEVSQLASVVGGMEGGFDGGVEGPGLMPTIAAYHR